MTDEKVEGAVTAASSTAPQDKAAEKPKAERKSTRKKTSVDFLGREGADGRDFLGRTI